MTRVLAVFRAMFSGSDSTKKSRSKECDKIESLRIAVLPAQRAEPFTH